MIKLFLISSNKFKSFWLCSVLAGMMFLMVAGCKMPTPSYFRKEVSLKNGVWPSAIQPVFTMDISDTSAAYQTYILLRHDDAYPFSNIWLQMAVMQPGDTTYSKVERINLKLADVSGAWLGKGMGSVWEHKIPLGKKEGLHFSKSGVYQIRIVQMMRQDPLPGLLNVGIMVRKKD
jgi:gliding motility-associated lipoprotein GldH